MSLPVPDPSRRVEVRHAGVRHTGVRRAVMAALTYDAPSLRLRLAVAYFRVSGLLFIVSGAAMTTMGTVAAARSTGRPVEYLAASGVAIVAGLGALWTANLLRARRRKGAVVAITSLLAPVAQAAAFGASAGSSVPAILGALVVASVWNELE